LTSPESESHALRMTSPLQRRREIGAPEGSRVTPADWVVQKTLSFPPRSTEHRLQAQTYTASVNNEKSSKKRDITLANGGTPSNRPGESERRCGYAVSIHAD